jgi:hypothetical protein
VGAEDWFLTAGERGNAACRLPAWSVGNTVTALVNGASYFARLLDEVGSMGPGDHLFFTDWRGDADERLRDAGPTLGELFGAAARRGVIVAGPTRGPAISGRSTTIRNSVAGCRRLRKTFTAWPWARMSVRSACEIFRQHL